MTRCSDCGYKIEGAVYLIKLILPMGYHSTHFCKQCGDEKNRRSNKRFKVCGVCYLGYEEKADPTGYIDDFTGIPHYFTTEHKSSVQLLGKSKR